MTFKWLIYIPVAFAIMSIGAQNMQQGFNYLETGNYSQAESFFKTILKEYPSNKTARL
ncbi:MAG: hypothetical protein HKO94_05220, partial [Flavobacteriaceae bacterium]|nr:hypothetical protein [Flavobacteriaceae bacterium]